jgi:hypothetical protein
VEATAFLALGNLLFMCTLGRLRFASVRRGLELARDAENKMSATNPMLG